jgi:hypothetical protein
VLREINEKERGMVGPACAIRARSLHVGMGDRRRPGVGVHRSLFFSDRQLGLLPDLLTFELPTFRKVIRMRALLIILALTGYSAFAGTMQLAGEVKAMSADTMEISDGNHIYVIKRSAIKNKSALAKTVSVTV